MKEREFEDIEYEALKKQYNIRDYDLVADNKEYTEEGEDL